MYVFKISKHYFNKISLVLDCLSENNLMIFNDFIGSSTVLGEPEAVSNPLEEFGWLPWISRGPARFRGRLFPLFASRKN